jgi:maleylpyruvate isomerase
VSDVQAQRAAALDGARAAHRRLIADVENLTDDAISAPSRLPGWTVGHVMTHLARNADSFVGLMSAAINGDAVTQYEGGHEQRSADIAAGAARPAKEQIADVVDSIDRLEAVWQRMTPDAWAGHGLNAMGEVWQCEAMPFHRWREVEIHHVDLGLGYSVADWPDDYVDRELAISLRLLPERLDGGDQRLMLAWLLGRGQQPAVTVQPWQFHHEHYLR